MMPLAEESDITIVYDPTRGWEYSMEEITATNDHAHISRT